VGFCFVYGDGPLYLVAVHLSLLVFSLLLGPICQAFWPAYHHSLPSLLASRPVLEASSKGVVMAENESHEKDLMSTLFTG
jgi:hypothetical protein